MEESPLRTLVASSGNTYLYENKYSLPLGFMVDDEVAERWDYKNGGGVSNQNELAELLGAQEEMLSVVPAESEVGVSTIILQHTVLRHPTPLRKRSVMEERSPLRRRPTDIF